MRYNDTKAHIPVGNHFKETVIDLSSANGCDGWGEGNDKVHIEETRIAEGLNARIPIPKQEEIAQHGMSQSGITQAAALAPLEDMHVQMYQEKVGAGNAKASPQVQVSSGSSQTMQLG